ncbi:MAG: RrF2 family transcriptional regulator [Limisphaerales bacterium]
MKLTSRCEYAMLALIYLGRQKTGTLLSVDVIARTQNIPPKFLEQIMLTLKRAKYVRSAKGRNGGYQLAKPMERISLAEIIRLFDGALAPSESVSEHFYEPTPLEKEEKLVHVFRDIRDYASKKLEATTIGDML